MKPHLEQVAEVSDDVEDDEGVEEDGGEGGDDLEGEAVPEEHEDVHDGEDAAVGVVLGALGQALGGQHVLGGHSIMGSPRVVTFPRPGGEVKFCMTKTPPHPSIE